MIHDYKLRPYHNPKGADESLVPDGWRMLYADEFPLSRDIPCRMFVKPIYADAPPPHFDSQTGRSGSIYCLTYIVPVML